MEGGTSSALALATSGAVGAHPDLSGVSLLDDAHDAFAARMQLAQTAERTLDLQYYIWHGDRSGTLMLEAIHQAAERGVAVRLLLDDNGISGLDTILAALDRHPNIAVRLFNPFRIRFPKAIGFVFDFHRLNRRMHNKSFTADRAVTIVGGRNIGDEYFGTGDGGLFADLDVLAVGPVVDAVAEDFERYWDCASAYPAAQILPRMSESKRQELAKRASIIERDRSARKFVERIRDLPLIRSIVDGTIALTWAPVRLISDPPEKALGPMPESSLLAGQIESAIGEPEHELCLVAGYLVPGREGTAMFTALAGRGIAISVLTNSYAANDVGVVHAGYAPWRADLLSAGIRLFEICGKSRHPQSGKERRRGQRVGIGSTLRGSGGGSMAALRSSASTLHAKTFAVDRKRLFVGSFNFDPRSVHLNTEMGFVIDSAELASRVADRFEDTVPTMAYEVTRSTDGELRWIERVEGSETVHTREPDMTLADHLIIKVASQLPIGKLL